LGLHIDSLIITSVHDHFSELNVADALVEWIGACSPPLVTS
jgi:hypothetical protein